jgi:FMN-dependent NADH-azoreductase
MATLLHIDSSPSGENSISRALSKEFVQNWAAGNPNAKIVTRDLYAGSIPPVAAPWIMSIYAPEAARTPEQKELIKLSDVLVDELLSADVIVLGVPMHNFSVPSVLKLWIDQIIRGDKTFKRDGKGMAGLVTGKEVHIFVASGGVYDPGTPTEGMNFVEPYLRTALGFIGITDIRFLHAGGTAAIMRGEIDREALLKPYLETIRVGFRR